MIAWHSLMDTPQLSGYPTLYPDCCCPISDVLIQMLASILPSDPDLTFSIGSGSGLLEALLLRESSYLNIHAVEVSADLNKYLPEERMQLVRGTWDLASSARQAATWLFVYPRDLELIRKYIQLYGNGGLRQIIWIGPQADLQEVEAILHQWAWIESELESIGHGSVMLRAERGIDIS